MSPCPVRYSHLWSKQQTVKHLFTIVTLPWLTEDTGIIFCLQFPDDKGAIVIGRRQILTRWWPADSTNWLQMPSQIGCQLQTRQSILILTDVPNLIEKPHCENGLIEMCIKYKPKHVSRSHQKPTEFYHRHPMASAGYRHTTPDHDYARKFQVSRTSWSRVNETVGTKINRIAKQDVFLCICNTAATKQQMIILKRLTRAKMKCQITSSFVEQPICS